MDTVNNVVRLNIHALRKAILDPILSQVKEEEEFNKLCLYVNSPQAEKLGRGSQGVVYKVYGECGCCCAVKVASIEKMNHKDLLREFEKLSSYPHRRLISVYNFHINISRKEAYLIMDYMAGGSLDGRIETEGKLSLISSLKILTQVIEGVAYLHDHGIMHSDIKPSNILLTEDDNVKLADFGLAVHDKSVSSHNRGYHIGTINYCSPEVLKGDPRSRKNDCWSIGATLVHMVTGNPLNHSDSGYKLLMNIIQYNLFYNGVPLETALNSSDIANWVKDILKTTLCDPQSRATASKLLEICNDTTNAPPAPSSKLEKTVNFAGTISDSESVFFFMKQSKP